MTPNQKLRLMAGVWHQVPWRRVRVRYERLAAGWACIVVTPFVGGTASTGRTRGLARTAMERRMHIIAPHVTEHRGNLCVKVRGDDAPVTTTEWRCAALARELEGSKVCVERRYGVGWTAFCRGKALAVGETRERAVVQLTKLLKLMKVKRNLEDPNDPVARRYSADVRAAAIRALDIAMTDARPIKEAFAEALAQVHTHAAEKGLLCPECAGRAWESYDELCEGCRAAEEAEDQRIAAIIPARLAEAESVLRAEGEA